MFETPPEGSDAAHDTELVTIEGDGWTEVVGRRQRAEALRVRLSWRDSPDASFWNEERQDWVNLPLQLDARVPSSGMCEDALGWLVGHLARPPGRSEPLRTRRGVPAGQRHLLTQADAIAAAFLARFDQDLLRLVRRYGPWGRCFLYARLVEDGTGRLRQLADACPGALLLYAGTVDPTDPVEHRIALALKDGVLAGRPLNGLIDETLRALLAHRASGTATDVDAGLLEAYRWLARAPAAVRERQLLRWRLLVRRAGRKVHPSHVVRPPPLGFEPDDIPTRVDANAAWFRGMHSHDAFIVPELGFGEETCRRAGLALSKAGGRIAWRLGNDFFFEWVHANPDLDVRRMSADELTQRSLAHLSADLENKAGLGRPFPPPPVEPVDLPGLRLVPLTDGRQLFDEGERMRHCVGSYAAKVHRRQSYVYAAHVGGERFTVEVEPMGASGWGLAQIRGVANAAPSPASVAALQAWCPRKTMSDG